MNENLNDLQTWLSECKIPPRVKREKSFMNIAGIGHLENNWSLIYAYFFNPKEKHQLGRLFIDTFKALIERTSSKAVPQLDTFSIIREYPTEDGKWIDLLIKNEKEAIIIENKVHAKLYNPLPSYWESVKSPNKIGVILSLHKISVKDTNFINITHEEFAKAINEALPQYCSSASQEVLCFLQDFINNIENETHAMNEEELKFYYQNESNRILIKRLSEIRSNVINHIHKSVEGENPSDRNYINDELKDNGIKLKVKNKDNNRFTYYYYENNEYSGLGEIMLTLKYDSLWNYETNGCRIDMFLEVQGNMLKFVESHKELLKEKGIESDQQATPQNGWWHFQKDEIRFETDELINQDSIREKIIEGIKNSPLYGNGLKIIECYTNH